MVWAPDHSVGGTQTPPHTNLNIKVILYLGNRESQVQKIGMYYKKSSSFFLNLKNNNKKN